jgi:hypothetical protein
MSYSYCVCASKTGSARESVSRQRKCLLQSNSEFNRDMSIYVLFLRNVSILHTEHEALLEKPKNTWEETIVKMERFSLTSTGFERRILLFGWGQWKTHLILQFAPDQILEEALPKWTRLILRVPPEIVKHPQKQRVQKIKILEALSPWTSVYQICQW